jgi:putative toxin-antitoxin system antitoxin component (TIGR02293 family)
MGKLPRRGRIDAVVARRDRGERSTAAQFSKLIHSDDRALVELTKQGIGPDVVVHLAEKLRVTPASFVGYIGMSRATLDRKQRNRSALGLVESDRLVRYTQLWKQAVHLWGSDDAARQWLTAPEPALGGVSPIEHAATEIGARQVEDLMGQIAHGIAT